MGLAEDVEAAIEEQSIIHGQGEGEEKGDDRLFSYKIPDGGRCTAPIFGFVNTNAAEDVVRVEDVSAKRKIGLTFLIAQPSVAVGRLLHRERANFEYIAHSILRHFINFYFYVLRLCVLYVS